MIIIRFVVWDLIAKADDRDSAGVTDNYPNSRGGTLLAMLSPRI